MSKTTTPRFGLDVGFVERTFRSTCTAPRIRIGLVDDLGKKSRVGVARV
ncbi:MAG TPA: hypothetical protein VF406_03885 [Thermodesulfobacteriota bacterium]